VIAISTGGGPHRSQGIGTRTGSVRPSGAIVRPAQRSADICGAAARCRCDRCCWRTNCHAATQDSAMAWFQRRKPCSTRPAPEGLWPDPPVLLGNGDAEKPLSPISGTPLPPPLVAVHPFAERVEFLAREAVGLIEDACCSSSRPKLGARMSPLDLTGVSPWRFLPIAAIPVLPGPMSYNE